MKLIEVSEHLRRTSNQYGGIKHFLKAAGDLDRAHNAFANEPTIEALTTLNGAVAFASRMHKQAVGDAENGPVAK